jgi:hypothetical protein
MAKHVSCDTTMTPSQASQFIASALETEVATIAASELA